MIHVTEDSAGTNYFQPLLFQPYFAGMGRMEVQLFKKHIMTPFAFLNLVMIMLLILQLLNPLMIMNNNFKVILCISFSHRASCLCEAV